MIFDEWIIRILAFIIGLMFSEIISDLILIKYESGFKLRFNFEALNPFISHDKAILAYIFEIILVGIFTILIEKIVVVLIANTMFYWIPITSLAITSLYILSIKKLNISMNARRWVIFTFLIIMTAGLFFIVYWIRHPHMFEETAKNLT